MLHRSPKSVTSGIKEPSFLKTHREMASECAGESQPPTQGAKRKKTQIEMVTSIESRLSLLEIQTETILSMEGRLRLLEGYVSRIEEHVMELKGDEGPVQELREVVAQLQSRVSSAVAPHHDIPKPKCYSGKRDATEVEDFLWHLEQYFKMANILNDQMRVQIASCYLTNSANVWWRWKCQEVENGEEEINTYKAFKKALKKQFLPKNVDQRARETLCDLRHTTTLQAYVQAFTEATLYLKDISEETLLFFFTSGLQKWAKDEVEKRDVCKLNQAILIVESLLEQKQTEVSGARPPPRSENLEREGGNRPSFNQNGATFNQNGGNRPTSSRNSGSRKGNISCFICNGPHFMRKCPKKGLPNAMEQEMVLEEPPVEEEHTMALQTFNSMKSEASKSATRSLMYVECAVNNRNVKAMIGSAATHNFVTPGEAKKLGLLVKNDIGSLKTVNNTPWPVVGIARGVDLHVGKWRGKIDFTVVVMDDHKLVLGLDFLHEANVFLYPAHSCMCIFAGEMSCMIPTQAMGPT